MSAENKKAASITEAASKMVSEWSNSKKAAFEQRTGLVVGKESRPISAGGKAGKTNKRGGK